MNRFPFEPIDDGFDLDGIGIDVADLDLDDLPLNLPPDLRTLIEQRSHWDRPHQWWHTTEQEAHHLDLPEFPSMDDRRRYMIEAMARPVLRRLNADADAPVLTDVDGEMVSLNDLLARFDYNAAVTKIMKDDGPQ